MYISDFVNKYGIMLGCLMGLVVTIIDTSYIKFTIMGFIETNEKDSFLTFAVVCFALSIVVITFFFCTYRLMISSKTTIRIKLPVVIFSVYQISYLIFTLIWLNMYYSYNYIFLYQMIIVTHMVSLFFLGWITSKFIRWWNTKPSKLVFLYMATFVLMIIFTGLSLYNYHLNIDDLFDDKIYMSFYNLVFNQTIADTSLNDILLVVMMLTFFSIWVTTSFMLRSYFKKLNSVLFWLLMAMPLIYSVIQYFLIELDLIYTLIMTNPVNNLLIYETTFLLSMPMTGSLLGLSIFIFSHRIINKQIRNSLHLLAAGIIILFLSFQPNYLFYFPVPPFGISIILIGSGSIMVSIGLFFSINLIGGNLSIKRELIKYLGAKNFLMDLSEGKVTNELTNVVRRVHQSMEEHHDNYHNKLQDEIPKDELEDYMQFIMSELKQNNPE